MSHAQTSARTSGFRAVQTLCVVLCLVLVSGCATRLMLEDVYRPDPKNPRATITATPEEVRAGISVVRAGQSIPVAIDMDLRIGDEINVRPPVTATIVFPEGHTVWLMPDTKVRLGSIIVESIGRFFVSAYGLFKVETEYWRAGVKGTQFYVHVATNQYATVAVIEGLIGLESKTGSWKPTDVNENEVVTLDRDRAPSKALKQRAELDAILQLMRTRNRPSPARSR